MPAIAGQDFSIVRFNAKSSVVGHQSWAEHVALAEDWRPTTDDRPQRSRRKAKL